MANAVPSRLVDSVNGLIGKVKLRLLTTADFNGNNSYTLEFVDQDGTVLDSVNIGIENVQGLQQALNEARTTSDSSYIPNTALNGYVKLSDTEINSIRREVEEYNARVLADGGTIENQINIKDVLGAEGMSAGIIIRDIKITNGVVEKIELDFLNIEDVQGLRAELDYKENILGNPTTDNEALLSKVDGTRSWKKLIEDKNFTYEQLNPTNSWTINHGLNKKPTLAITDLDENVVVGGIKYVDNNQVTLTFNSPFTGRVTFN